MADWSDLEGLRREFFVDERGSGLRATWHPDRDLVILSIWRGDGCVATFRLRPDDAARLGGLFAAVAGAGDSPEPLVPTLT